MSSYKHIFSLALCIAFAIIWIVGIIQIPQTFSTYPKEWIPGLIAGHGAILITLYGFALLGFYWSEEK